MSATEELRKHINEFGKKNDDLNSLEGKHEPDVLLRKIMQKDYVINSKEIGTDPNYVHELVWINVLGFIGLHAMAFMGLFIILAGGISIKGVVWAIIVLYAASEGVTIGAHRLFAHKTFKAKPLLRAILILLQTIAGQNSVFIWSRDHRLHHRYSDTDGDPHNSKRGFFFCHMGWLMMKKHPYVIELGRKVDMTDLQADWMVMMQKKFYYPLYAILAVSLPVWVPWRYFGDSLISSFLVCYAFRYVAELNGTWLVNSAAHLYGTRPYNKNLQPVESWFVSFISLGEGWHNYHHLFPWDYKAAEMTMHFNFTASIIRWLERIGLAYDLKSVPDDVVKRRILNNGDGSHFELGTPEAKSQVTVSSGPLHPLNPTYNAKYDAPTVFLKPEGLPLYHDSDYLHIQNNDINNNKEKE